MERNWETIREILIAAENLQEDNTLSLSDFDNERAYDISYHVELLEESGLVYATLSKTLGGGPTDFFLRRLTWHGHELLDSIRSDSVWSKTKSTFQEKGLGMTFELVKEVAVAIAKSAAGL
jgi:hypothetical protein